MYNTLIVIRDYDLNFYVALINWYELLSDIKEENDKDGHDEIYIIKEFDTSRYQTALLQWKNQKMSFYDWYMYYKETFYLGYVMIVKKLSNLLDWIIVKIKWNVQTYITSLIDTTVFCIKATWKFPDDNVEKLQGVPIDFCIKRSLIFHYKSP